MRNLIVGVVLLAALPASAQEPAQQTPPADQQPAAAPPPAEPAPTPQAVAPAPTNPPMTGPRILISTSMGDITLQLDSVRAPKSVANVLRYVREKHYDNTAFYRVAKGFVIQMGSFDANGKGHGIHPGPVALEANNGLSNLRGAVRWAAGMRPTAPRRNSISTWLTIPRSITRRTIPATPPAMRCSAR